MAAIVPTPRPTDVRAGIYTYPWDLEAEGYDLALGRIAAAGLNAVNLACAYHAGKFLLPHNPKRRVYFAEDGALYFRPRLERYGRLRPRVSEFVTPAADPLRALDNARGAHGLDLVAWVVCLHNSWLGERYPDCTLWNAFGDPYRHSLSPAHPDVGVYLRALVADVAANADIAAIELESPAYMGFAHKFHHEIIGIPLDSAQELLLSLSFTPPEMLRAREAGVDGEGLRARVATALTAAWSGDRAHVDGLLADPELNAYFNVRDKIVEDLLTGLVEVIHEVNPRIEVRFFAANRLGAGPAGESEALVAFGDAALAGYARSHVEATARARRLRALIGDRPVYGMVRAIAPDTTSSQELAPRVAAWRAGGVDGLNVYNYGLMTLPMLDACGEALRAH